MHANYVNIISLKEKMKKYGILWQAKWKDIEMMKIRIYQLGKILIQINI